MNDKMAISETDIKPIDATRKPVKKVEPLRNTIAEWAVTVLLLLFGTTTLVQAFVIPTGSMEDTLLVGDHLLVDKLTYAPAGSFSKFILPYSEPKHGDIIVFRYPGNIAETFVKRVIGVPGDHLRMTNRNIFRNGVKINEPYVFHKLPYDEVRDNFPTQSPPYSDGLPGQLQRDMYERNVVKDEIIIPPDHYFAMGDNRDNSLDSRYWGFVPRENIIGKPLIIYWSYQASTADLAGSTVGSMISHMIDLGEHFFTRTRWSRTLHVIRSVHDEDLPNHELPLNTGNPNP